MIQSKELTLGCTILVDGIEYQVNSLPLPKEIEERAEGIPITRELLLEMGYEDKKNDAIEDELELDLPSGNFATVFKFKDEDDWVLHLDDKFRMSLGGRSWLKYYHEIQALLSLLDK